jgi:hypothetical protein
MKSLHDLDDEARSPGTHFTRATFVAGALCEQSVGLCCDNGAMYRARAGSLVCVTGQSFRTGMVCPSDEVVRLCWECVVFCLCVPDLYWYY